jgi:hypothetical protein
MNGMLHDLLGERADAAGSPDLHLDELIAQGERRITRRRRVALGSTVAAVALTVGAGFALGQATDRVTPVGPPTNTPPSTADDLSDTADGSRPLTYGVGGTIHYGGRIIDAGEDADGLFVLDQGVAILTRDDGSPEENRLFFTDGDSEPVEIARGVEMLTVGEIGSLLVWLDGDDVVIYDIAVRAVVARVPLNGLRLANPITPLADAVYWTEYDDATATTVRDGQLVRYDLSTGARTPASQADYAAETWTTNPPVLVVGSVESRHSAVDFTVIDSRLEDDNPQGAPEPVFVAATGERLRVSVPAGYEGHSLWIFQWLDEDRFAVVADSGVKKAPIGDLLVCRISAGQCHTIANGEQDWLLPGPVASIGGSD